MFQLTREKDIEILGFFQRPEKGVEYEDDSDTN